LRKSFTLASFVIKNRGNPMYGTIDDFISEWKTEEEFTLQLFFNIDD
jgi:hypothetical protein